MFGIPEMLEENSLVYNIWAVPLKVVVCCLLFFCLWLPVAIPFAVIGFWVSLLRTFSVTKALKTLVWPLNFSEDKEPIRSLLGMPEKEGNNEKQKI
mgnify:CR=1 FL=1